MAGVLRVELWREVDCGDALPLPELAVSLTALRLRTAHCCREGNGNANRGGVICCAPGSADAAVASGCEVKRLTPNGTFVGIDSPRTAAALPCPRDKPGRKWQWHGLTMLSTPMATFLSL